MEDLKADYKRGLVVAISFCVFVMPLLLPKTDEIPKKEHPEKCEEDKLDENAVRTGEYNEESGEGEVKLAHQDSVDNGRFQAQSNNDDEVDGSTSFNKSFTRNIPFSNLAQDRLVDGIKEVLEDHAIMRLARLASMDYDTTL